MGITFVYVTHDQEEALTMSDTIVVMNGGKIQQIGTPTDIYNEPKNAFVANFIGESNIIDGTMVRDRLVTFAYHTFPLSGQRLRGERPGGRGGAARGPAPDHPRGGTHPGRGGERHLQGASTMR